MTNFEVKCISDINVEFDKEVYTYNTNAIIPVIVVKDGETVGLGDTVTYTITVTNAGNVTCKSVTCALLATI